jgi:O-antigen/teichoic acid export membrane protein
MRVVLNSLRNILFRSLTVVFLLTMTVLTGRLLGPGGRGVYALVTLYSSMSVALFGGMGTAVGYMISNRRRPVPEVVANAGMLALLAGTLALALALAGYWTLGLFTTAPWWLVFVGAAQPAVLIATALTWAFLGADDHHRYSLAIIAPSLLSLLIMAPIMALFRGSTTAALMAWLVAQYGVVYWLWRLGRRVWTPLPLHRLNFGSMNVLIGFSLMSGLANLVSILNLRADTLFTDWFLGTAQVGVYSIAVTLVEGLYFISQAAGVALWARVGGATPEEAAHLIARAIRYTLTLMAAGGLVLFLVAGFAIPFAFGSDYAGAVAPFRVFVPGVVAWGMANLLATFYTNQLGRPRVPLAIASLSLAINVVCCVVFIPLVGLSGGAIATTLSYLVAIAVELRLFHRETGATWRETLLLDANDVREALHTARTARDALRQRGRQPVPAPTRPAPARDGWTGAPGPLLEPDMGEPLFRRVRRADAAMGERR